VNLLARSADAVFLILGWVSARDSRPDFGHLFRLDRASDAPGYALAIGDPGGASVGLSRTCWRRYANQDAGFWNSFRGRRGQGPIRLLDGWGFRTRNPCY
jgi:hypothetical protein